jgi:glucose-6-phosphate dehydrogenase assembly protein OpcA
VRSDAVWSAADTTPDEVAAALRRLVVEHHQEHPHFVPARALNMVCVVDRDWSGEIANRLRGVGRYHASRTVVCQIERGRRTLDARCSVVAGAAPGHGEFGVLRETIVLTVGDRHVRQLATIAGPLMITDVATVVWSPHGYPEAVDALLPLAQSVLHDSITPVEPADALDRAAALAERVYVVDLAWLRTTPWRERLAAYVDPPSVRPLLDAIDRVTARYRAGSEVAALLVVGWLASRLGWEPAPLAARDGGWSGRARGPGCEVGIVLEPVEQDAPGMAGVSIHTADGTRFSLDRAPGGLLARRRDPDGGERAWTVLGASRGEAGILGEGIRQALLRDPTFLPGLRCARAFAA